MRNTEAVILWSVPTFDVFTRHLADLRVAPETRDWPEAAQRRKLWSCVGPWTAYLEGVRPMRRSRMLAGVLGGLLGLPATALATSFAYVVHLGGLLTVINTNSSTVETTLQVGGAGNFSYVAVNSDGSRVYT